MGGTKLENNSKAHVEGHVADPSTTSTPICRYLLSFIPFTLPLFTPSYHAPNKYITVGKQHDQCCSDHYQLKERWFGSTGCQAIALARAEEGLYQPPRGPDVGLRQRQLGRLSVQDSCRPVVYGSSAAVPSRALRP